MQVVEAHMYSRAFEDSDTPLVDELHEKYFKGQFNRPYFEKGYLNAFVISNNKKEPLIVGGVRPLAETIIVTDIGPDVNRLQLRRALGEALRISRHICKQYGIEYLHAFVKDEQYAKHLLKAGFTPRCKALSLKV